MFVEPQIVQHGSAIHVQHGNDAGLYVEFFMHATEDKEKTIAEGRPMFKERPYIRIRTVGDSKTEVNRPVRTEWNGGMPPDTERFARQWNAFQNQQTQVNDGTPVTEWAVLTKSDALSLKALNIHTVEQLASLGDNNLTWLGARSMRDKAIAWLEQAKSGAGISQLMADNEKLRMELEGLKNQINGLGVDLSAKKRGRPAKVENDE